ncbi:MAG: LLM class flavin-dependent oxidoreductase [SAR202 cluster bacterium]|nr:LLM class flavin-dependent oxidoreductase [SAR202 cluster bacterium]
MNFGVFLDFSTRQGGTQPAAFRENFDLVDLAETTGLDTMWLGETHFNANRPISAPTVVASAIAARTQRLRVGMAVQVLPLISPLRIAEELATVDQVSQGRFEVGVGRSGNVRAYEVMGIPYDESRERFQEALDIILEAWKGKPFSYHGEFNQIDNATVTPEPFQKPHPPIRLASTGEDSFSRVGRLGFPIFLSMRGMDVHDLERNLKEYHRAWREARHPGEGGDISVRVPMYISTSAEGAKEEPRETIEAFFTRMRQRYEQGRDEEGGGGSAAERAAALKIRAERLARMTYEELLETRVISGTPEAVVERLQQFQESLGLTGFAAELNPGGLLPPEVVQRSLRLLTEEVMPAFK